MAYAASATDTDAGTMYVFGGYGDDSTNFHTESAMSVRTNLGLRTSSKPYHQMFNSLVWKCGCR